MDEFELEIKKSLETEYEDIRAPNEIERNVVRSTVFTDVLRSLIVFYVGAFVRIWGAILGRRGRSPSDGARQ
jgi:hypothetical protein